MKFVVFCAIKWYLNLTMKLNISEICLVHSSDFINKTINKTISKLNRPLEQGPKKCPAHLRLPYLVKEFPGKIGLVQLT